MSAASKISKIIAVFAKHGIDVDLHAEHDVLMFLGEEDIEFAEELEDAGARFDSEYDCWTTYCSG